MWTNKTPSQKAAGRKLTPTFCRKTGPRIIGFSQFYVTIYIQETPAASAPVALNFHLTYYFIAARRYLVRKCSCIRAQRPLLLHPRR